MIFLDSSDEFQTKPCCVFLRSCFVIIFLATALLGISAGGQWIVKGVGPRYGFIACAAFVIGAVIVIFCILRACSACDSSPTEDGDDISNATSFEILQDEAPVEEINSYDISPQQARQLISEFCQHMSPGRWHEHSLEQGFVVNLEDRPPSYDKLSLISDQEEALRPKIASSQCSDISPPDYHQISD
uniref:uncharacterized protein LOC120343043 n=1 Tax=Styela clava TaxID=7725 RepID=UPI001939FA15|nr:uncharacterized protein LOC120343043 [Styela clava]